MTTRAYALVLPGLERGKDGDRDLGLRQRRAEDDETGHAHADADREHENPHLAKIRIPHHGASIQGAAVPRARVSMNEASEVPVRAVSAALLIAVAVALPAASERYDACRLVRVIDGDTIEVDCEGDRERVRLLRIDTPERGEPGFAQARDALEALIGAGPVELEFEIPGEIARDKYERLLAYVRVGGENLNVAMVAEGWSPFWTNFGRGRHAAAFERAEAVAGPSEDPSRIQSPPATQSDAGDCRPRSSCCRVCSKGRACGASCIRASNECHKGRGCACNASEVCP